MTTLNILIIIISCHHNQNKYNNKNNHHNKLAVLFSPISVCIPVGLFFVIFTFILRALKLGTFLGVKCDQTKPWRTLGLKAMSLRTISTVKTVVKTMLRMSIT